MSRNRIETCVKGIEREREGEWFHIAVRLLISQQRRRRQRRRRWQQQQHSPEAGRKCTSFEHDGGMWSSGSSQIVCPESGSRWQQL